MASRIVLFCAALLAGATASHFVTAGEAVLCLDRDEISSSLADAHGERPSAAGLASNGELLEIYASPGGTWTLVMTRPSGESCAVASGEGWHQELAREVDDADS